jgi:hypothetical protein
MKHPLALLFLSLLVVAQTAVSTAIPGRSEVIEQRFGAVVLPHHDQLASDDQNPTEHEQDHFLLTCFC